jgi:Outer membrane receptor for ferrienterochelin and colicins
MHTMCFWPSSGSQRVEAIGAALAVLILSFAATAPARAQDTPTGTLSGRVVDAQTDEPLQNATVALWTETATDSTLVTGTVTGPEGRFSIDDVAVDAYTLRISFVGYSTQRFPDTRPAQDAEDADLGTIQLAPKTTQQGEVEVTADRPAARIETDRNVYNTSERALSAGGSARTVLEDLPSIRIDMDGSISFRGNESVSLQINGDPASLQGQSLVSYLESLSADAVERVEVIPNPSAKYEPEGMSGIINIVLSRDLEAKWNGGLTLGGERDANDRYGGNRLRNVGVQAGGWRVVGTYSHRRDSEEDTDARTVERFAQNESNTWVDQTGREEEQDRSHSFRTEVDYNFAESTSLGLETSLSLRRDDESGRTDYWEYAGSEPTAANLTDRYVRVLDNSSSDESVDGRFDFGHDFSEDHSLEAQVRYDRDFETEDGLYNVYGVEDGTRLSSPRERELDVVNEDEQDGSLEIDYSRPLGAFSLETGYKGTLRRLDSDQTYEGRTTVFTFDELIHAAYGTLSKGSETFSWRPGSAPKR